MRTNHRKLDVTKEASNPSLFLKEWGTFRPKLIQRFLIGLTQKTVLQRGKLRMLMTKAIFSLGRPLDIEFRSCRFRIGVQSNLIETGLLTRPSYNALEIEFLKEGLGEHGTAVDIGCNVGLYSLPLAKAAGSSGTIVSIDANSDMIDHLKFNADASGLTNIVPVHLAVGESQARVDLQISKEDVAIVHVEKNDSGATEMKPLLDILESAGLDHLDCLKIDIEGYEDKAMVPFLQNAREELLPSRIVIEKAGVDFDYPGCVAEFERLGYRLRGRTRNNSMYERA